jgi:magnesium transporter
MIKKRVGWLSALFLGEMLTTTAMAYFEHEIARAVVLALFIPLIISSRGNSGSATSLVIRAIALGEVRLRDWWRVAAREVVIGLVLGAIHGIIGLSRILCGPAAPPSTARTTAWWRWRSSAAWWLWCSSGRWRGRCCRSSCAGSDRDSPDA